MRIAVLSDIHGNLTALEAVLADLRKVSPDLVLHGGDLADGSSPGEVIDLIRDLGWNGVLGNTDEMLFRPESLEAFAGRSSAPAVLWDGVREIAEYTRERLGQERLEWMRKLPMIHTEPSLAIVHAIPADCWRAPGSDGSDEALASVYGELDRPLVIFGHTHRPFVRQVLVQGMYALTIANSGSVGLPYDGDPRASFLVVDRECANIRRVAYDIERELHRLTASATPHFSWIARMLRTATAQMP